MVSRGSDRAEWRRLAGREVCFRRMWRVQGQLQTQQEWSMMKYSQVWPLGKVVLPQLVLAAVRSSWRLWIEQAELAPADWHQPRVTVRKAAKQSSAQAVHTAQVAGTLVVPALVADTATSVAVCTDHIGPVAGTQTVAGTSIVVVAVVVAAAAAVAGTAVAGPTVLPSEPSL